MSFFDGPNPGDIENWVCILERGTEYEVAMAKNYLSNLKIPSNILSKRDSSYNLNIGETSMVYLYVPVEFESRARRALEKLENAHPDWEDEAPWAEEEQGGRKTPKRRRPGRKGPKWNDEEEGD